LVNHCHVDYKNGFTFGSGYFWLFVNDIGVFLPITMMLYRRKKSLTCHSSSWSLSTFEDVSVVRVVANNMPDASRQQAAVLGRRCPLAAISQSSPEDDDDADSFIVRHFMKCL
jgi:hypothetical protein